MALKASEQLAQTRIQNEEKSFFKKIMISINFIPHARYQYADGFLKEIVKISKESKKKININFIVTSKIRDWNKDIVFLSDNLIQSKLFHIRSGNYMLKILTAISNSSKYSVKLDEDIFIPKNVWEYMIENISILDNNDNLFLTPLLSTGIPSSDRFVEQFFLDSEKENLFKIYLNTKIPNVWGLNFDSLNTLISNMLQWNSEKFYELLDNIEGTFKGIHPLRFSLDAQKYILECTLEKFDNFYNESNFTLFYDKKPYFCNSVFCIRTDIWNKVLNYKMIKEFKDNRGLDEVPLSIYRKQNDLNMVFIDRSFCVHPSYNSLGAESKTLTDIFYKNILTKI